MYRESEREPVRQRAVLSNKEGAEVIVRPECESQR